MCGLPFGPSSLDISSKEGSLAASSAKMSQSTKKYPVILHLQPEVRFGSILSVFRTTCPKSISWDYQCRIGNVPAHGLWIQYLCVHWFSRLSAHPGMEYEVSWRVLTVIVDSNKAPTKRKSEKQRYGQIKLKYWLFLADFANNYCSLSNKHPDQHILTKFINFVYREED